MKLSKSPIALAVFAAASMYAGASQAQSTPAPTSGSLDLWFKAPLNGRTVSGTLSGSSCYLAGSGVARVQFYLDGTALNSDTTMTDGMQCVLDTRRFSNGTHTLKATATSSSGATRSDVISINIQNSAATPPPPANAAPTVSFASPAAGTVSGTVSYSANVADDKAVTRVVFKVDGATVAERTAAPWSGSLNTTTLANGAHTITATAYDAEGLNTTSSRSITVSNNTAPSVSFSSPAAGTVSGTVSVAALASDDKAVTRVVFKVDGTTVAERTASPWSASLDTRTLSNAGHTITATAYDAEGLNTTASRAVTVSNVVTPPAPTPTTSTPPPTSGSLDVWFKSPRSGNTVSGVLSGTSCYVAGTGVTRVAFRVDSTALNTDTTMSDGMQCVLDTTKLSNGMHTLTAMATSATGATRLDVISINVQNSGTPPTPTPTNVAPAVSFTSPAAGTVSGTVNYAVNASDDKAVSRVVFKLDGTTIADKTAAPWSGSLNTTSLTNAGHALTATAYDAEGLNTTATVALNVNNATTTPPVTQPPSSGGMPTDASGVQGVATFESIGLYWANPGASTATGCKVQYRKQGESAWRDGLDMWFDSRNSECRGSLVHLAPGTNYEVQMGLPGQSFRKGLAVATWSEQYPIASTVTLTPGSGQVNITQGGTKDGYVLYTAAPGTVLDVNNSADHNFLISAKYVIVRGLTLRGARIDAIRLAPGSGDVVIENNDISNWGRTRGGGLAQDYDSGVRASCTSSFRLERAVVQRNRIHDPRYGSNSWDTAHPEGAQAITFSHCGGQHVIRYNDIYSSAGKYFNDGIGGEDNFSDRGFPYADTDIYGNRISGVYDDAIETEGANRNVRIWGNYTDGTYTSIASTVTHVGPFYVFRNVGSNVTTFAKSGQAGGYGGGRRYFFHNTTLGTASEGIKGNSNQPMTNSWTRNNVLQLRSSGGIAIGVSSGSEINADYDMSNANMRPYSGAEANGIVGSPTYVSGHGPANPAGGNYQLAPGSRGAGQGVRIPNFNDAYAAPDMGAHQGGTPAMKFGIQ